MSVRRIGVLLTKEIRQGASNFLAVYAVAMPLLLSLLVTLVFGDLFAEAPRLGLLDHDQSRLATVLEARQDIRATRYESEVTLREDVARGRVEMGVILPEGLDQALQGIGEAEVHVLRWGEMPARNLLVLGSAMGEAFAEVAGLELPIQVEAVPLGADAPSWSERLLPLLVIMTVILGGTMVPAALLVEEKQRRTLSALTTTPVTLGEVYTAKALLGILLSIAMGLLVLVINRAFGNQPALLVTVLAVSALAASVFGVLLGTLVKDVESLLATLKALGLVLFAPGLLQLFPGVPAWISQLFPTYYMMNPVLEISQGGASIGAVLGDVAILLGMVGLLMLLLAFTVDRQKERIALLA
jgi:ABC-2 type transport system permease protein